MSDIVIEGKNIKDINQSNFQSVGPYSDGNNTVVIEPWQARNIVNGENQDKRFELGTYTENNREFWEIKTTNKDTRKSQIKNKKMRTARAHVDDKGLVISDETEWSVDTFPFARNDDDESVPLYFYYDKNLHPNEYKTAVNGMVNLKIELRESGRDNTGIIDNFLVREPHRPFILELTIENQGDAGGEVIGDGAYIFNDLVTIEALPDEKSYFLNWSGDANSTNLIYNYRIPRGDSTITANFFPNPILKVTVRVDNSLTWNEYWGTPAEFYILNEETLTQIYNNLQDIHNITEPSTLLSEFENWQEYVEGFFTPEEKTDNLNRPGELFLIARRDNPHHNRFLFQNYTYVNVNNEEIELDTREQIAFGNLEEIENTVYGDGDLGEHVVLSKGSYPEDPNAPPAESLQVYLNYSAQFYEIQSWNSFLNAGERAIGTRLRDGYGDVRIKEFGHTDYTSEPGFKQYILNTSRHLQLFEDPNGGYIWSPTGWFYGAEGNEREYFTAEEIVEISELSGIGGENLTDIQTLHFNATSSMAIGSPGHIINQIVNTANSRFYIGHTFNQQGVYVKITKTDNSHNFTIDPPNITNVIRNKEHSPDIDADMFQIGPNLTLSWVFTVNQNHALGEVGELPTLISLTKGSGDPILNLEDYNMTYEETSGNSMQFSYTTPENFSDENYLKYIELTLRSNIVPAPLDPFIGIFDLIFNTNNSGWGEISLLQEADEIPQTTYIGPYGVDNNIETPTYAIGLGQWLNPDYNYTPIAIDVNNNHPDADLTSIISGLNPNYSSVLEEILSNSYFNDYDSEWKQSVLDNFNSYLDIEVSSNNALSVTPNENYGSLFPDIVDRINEVLTFVKDNNDLPRIPIRVNATFSQIYTININKIDVLNNNNTYPTKWVTNWDQAAYEANPSMENIENWTDDSLLDTSFSNMNEENSTITIPSGWFNGIHELIIRQQIAPQSEANSGTDNLFQQSHITIPFDLNFNSEELGTFNHQTRITNVSQGFTITLNWAGMV